MDDRLDGLDPTLARLDALLSGAAPALAAGRRPAIERWRADADALRFHLKSPRGGRGMRDNGPLPLLVAVLGGTGTGKSTLVNRLLGRTVSAASFRRTFTSGAVAVVPDAAAGAVPDNWLGVEHVPASAADLPARGRIGALFLVSAGPPPAQLASFPVLIDTPDLDGDQPAHHAQADRVFRWAQAVLFLVTPEKYQMTELLPYYRLARRYAVPALYVMNKCEEQAVVEDYRAQLEGPGAGLSAGASGGEPPASPSPALFVLPRDDAAYEPPAAMNLDALRQALASLRLPGPTALRAGLRDRAADLLGRLSDQVLAPLREDRKHADELIESLRAMEAPSAGVDVNPLTRQLHRRLQQRSILYLMGPGRVMDRVRQAPMILARLPRFAWDYLRSGQVSAELLDPTSGFGAQTVPDFRAALANQFAVLQSRIDDALRASPAGRRWIEGPGIEGSGIEGPGIGGENVEGMGIEGAGSDGASHAAGEAALAPYARARVDPAEAGRIADEELADLKKWLEQKWNATPRDTRTLEGLLRYLPGGRALTRWTEAAPYLLTVVLIVAHHAISGGADLVVVGGYTLATWITERLSNEVTARTRATNARIESRFADLAHEQIGRACDWLDRQAPPAKLLDELDREAGRMAEGLGEER